MATVKTIKRGELARHGYVPPEGTRGYSLRKASDDDADFEWGPGQWYDLTAAEIAAGLTTADIIGTVKPVDPTRYGADPTGTSDSHAAFQTAWDVINAQGGVLVIPPGIYKISESLDFRRDSSASTTQYRYGVLADGVVLNCQEATDITEIIQIGATAQANTNEAGKWVLRGMHILGPETNASSTSITAINTPLTSSVGFRFSFILNLVMENLHVLQCHTGYRLNFCFPIDAKSVISQNCYIGLRLGSDITTGTWKDCGFRTGRFGIVMQPDSSTATVAGQLFQSVNIEGNEVGCVMDPLDGGTGVGVRNIKFDNPYLESIARDGFRLGRSFNFDDASDVGTNRDRDLCNIEWEGGTWDAGDGTPWGSPAHDAIRVQSVVATNPPYSLRLIGVPVADSGMDLRGARDVTFINAKDTTTGATADNFQALSGYAFVRFDATGATGVKTIRVAKNVTQVEKTSAAGEFQLSFTRAYKSSSSYTATVTCHGGKRYGEVFSTAAQTMVIRTYDDTGTLNDPSDDISVAVFGIE
jgi:hypothetical protein